jgi:hypothetical protein
MDEGRKLAEQGERRWLAGRQKGRQGLPPAQLRRKQLWTALEAKTAWEMVRDGK